MEEREYQLATEMMDRFVTMMSMMEEKIGIAASAISGSIDRLTDATKEAFPPEDEDDMYEPDDDESIPDVLVDGMSVVVIDDQMPRVGTINTYPNGELYVRIDKGR